MALAALVPHLAEPWLRGALEAAWGIGDEEARSRALAALAPRLAELGHPAKALEAARAIGDAWDRSLRAGRAGPPPGADRAGPRPSGEALEKARSRALAALAPHLTEPWLREALEAARAIYGEGEPVLAAGRAGPAPGGARPPGRGAGGGAGHPRRGGPGPMALAALASHLGPTERDRALGEALEAARAIGDERARSEALAALASHLAADRAGPSPRRGTGGGAGHRGREGPGPRRWPSWPGAWRRSATRLRSGNRITFRFAERSGIIDYNVIWQPSLLVMDVEP